MNLTQDELLREQYLLGKLYATREWAHWKEGVQYVGSCGTTLEDALAPTYKTLAEFEALRNNIDPHRRIKL